MSSCRPGCLPGIVSSTSASGILIAEKNESIQFLSILIRGWIGVSQTLPGSIQKERFCTSLPVGRTPSGEVTGTSQDAGRPVNELDQMFVHSPAGNPVFLAPGSPVTSSSRIGTRHPLRATKAAEEVPQAFRSGSRSGPAPLVSRGLRGCHAPIASVPRNW